MRTLCLLLLATSALAQDAQLGVVPPALSALTYNNGVKFVSGTSLTANTDYTITATVNSATRSVVFKREGGTVTKDSSPPFQYSFRPAEVGNHSLTAIPWSGLNGTGTKGNPMLVNFSVATSTSPTPAPTGTATPTPATPSPSPSPTATSTPTATPSPTSTPQPSQSPTPTATPSGTPSPNLAYVTVTVQWVGTKDDRYTILYGTANPPDTQADGGIAVRDGNMTVAISGLKPNTSYFFSNIVTDPTGTESPPLPPIQYQTTATANQLFKLGNFQLKRK